MSRGADVPEEVERRRRRGDAATRPAPDRRIPALRHAPGPTRPGGPGRSRHRHPRGGDRGRRRAARHPGRPAEASARRRLPLRGGLVGHQPALGGGAVRGLLSHHRRTGARARRGDHPRGVPRPRRLPIGRLDSRTHWRTGVLIADRLDGRPLDGDHGAPVRLVSPAQYGYISTKHLCRIEVHTREPKTTRGRPASAIGCSDLIRGRGSPKRNATAALPGWFVRPLYRPSRPRCSASALGERGSR